MTHHLRRFAALLALLVVGTGLAYVASPTPALALPAAPAARADDAGRPEVGDCHTLTSQESPDLADPDPAVPCTKKHTSRTLVVFDLPKGTKFSDKQAIYRLIDNRCAPVWRKTVGGSIKDRYLATFSQVYFFPTKAQQNKGARWLRCDLVQWAGTQLSNLPNDDVPALGAKPYSDKIAKCHLGKKGRYLSTTCSHPHASRSKGVFTMSGKNYPSDKARYNAAAKHCPRFTGSDQWLSFPPSEDQWNAGFKLFLCDAITTS